VAAVNLTTGAWTEHRPTGEFLAASIVKLEILIALLLQLEADGREPSVAQTRRARQMITASDNDAADELWGDIGGRSGLGQACRKLGMTHTVPAGGGYWGATRTTPRDQLRVVQALVDPGALQHAHCGYVRGLMHDVAPEQRWGISAAELVRTASGVLGGGGGGSAEIAQGGGADAAKLGEALRRLEHAVGETVTQR